MIDFDAASFARSWVAAWNSHDVEAVLAHFHDDAVFSSPVALLLGYGEMGAVHGKRAIRRYWTKALAANPELHFELNAVYGGTDALVIVFKTQDGILRAEVLTFANGLVVSGFGTLPQGS